MDDELTTKLHAYADKLGDTTSAHIIRGAANLIAKQDRNIANYESAIDHLKRAIVSLKESLTNKG